MLVFEGSLPRLMSVSLYLSTHTQAQFKEDGSVQLQDFLSKKWAALLDAAVKREDDRDCVGRGKTLSHSTGLRDGWKAVGEWVMLGGRYVSSSVKQLRHEPDSAVSETTSKRHLGGDSAGDGVGSTSLTFCL